MSGRRRNFLCSSSGVRIPLCSRVSRAAINSPWIYKHNRTILNLFYALLTVVSTHPVIPSKTFSIRLSLLILNLATLHTTLQITVLVRFIRIWVDNPHRCDGIWLASLEIISALLPALPDHSQLYLLTYPTLNTNSRSSNSQFDCHIASAPRESTCNFFCCKHPTHCGSLWLSCDAPPYSHNTK